MSADVDRLEPAIGAMLRWRGFSAEVTPDGREPFGYDYDQRQRALAVEGDAGPLHAVRRRAGAARGTDDQFVVSRPGDEIALAFDAAALPPLPAGWTRTFLLYADGYSKEMDLNSASPDGSRRCRSRR